MKIKQHHCIHFNSLPGEHQQLVNSLFPGLLEHQGPVGVFGYYRSGTSGLCDFIALVKQIRDFGELLDERNGDLRLLSEELTKTSTPFIFSVKPQQYHYLPHCFRDFSSPLYKIKLNRKNNIDLITSSCLVQLDNLSYKFNPLYPRPEYAVEIDQDVIRNHIWTHLVWEDSHKQIDLTYKFHAIVNFEDVKVLYQYTNTVPSWKPLNYDEVKSAVEAEYYKLLEVMKKRNEWMVRLGT